ncbi:helix-turn-helix transcriptional regulator [Spiroplasma endosymbiont of Agriotes lineatus]|uniref:helix-turn-helix domain-containing protein n=1 Tax=Spiroplasma endosymbiont of Agriotes lineatus TaxID=3077930 RepID=UPI0030CA9680
MIKDVMDVKIKFGQQIRQLRVNLHLSQEELAYECDLNKNYISDIERGERNISLQSIAKLAKGLQVSLSELFDFDYQI